MNINVKKRNGRLQPFLVEKINANVERACKEIEDTSVSEVLLDAQLQLFDKITTSEIDTALILSAREKIEKEPNYSFAGARLLLNTIYKEVFKEGVDSDTFRLQYRKSFIQNIKKLVNELQLNDQVVFLKNITQDLKNALMQFERQALHSKKLTLKHPTTGNVMSWEIELAEDMSMLLDVLNSFDK